MYHSVPVPVCIVSELGGLCVYKCGSGIWISDYAKLSKAVQQKQDIFLAILYGYTKMPEQSNSLKIFLKIIIFTK